MKKNFTYLLLAITIGCKTGGHELGPTPSINQVTVAFAKMIADKKFASLGGTTFSQSEGTKFTFSNQGGVTFSDITPCYPVESSVKINGATANYNPAECELEDVWFIDNGNYYNLGKFYFISAFASDGKTLVVFAFRGGKPQSGFYQLDSRMAYGYSQPIASDGVGSSNGYYYSFSGEVTINSENGFRVSAPHLYGWYSTFSINMGCCNR